MPKGQITLEDVIAEIQDTLPDTSLHKAEFGSISSYRGHNNLNGYYVHYWIYKTDVDRAVFLGTDAITIKRNFDKWVKKWMVQ